TPDVHGNTYGDRHPDSLANFHLHLYAYPDPAVFCGGHMCSGAVLCDHGERRPLARHRWMAGAATAALVVAPPRALGPAAGLISMVRSPLGRCRLPSPTGG